MGAHGKERGDHQLLLVLVPLATMYTLTRSLSNRLCYYLTLVHVVVLTSLYLLTTSSSSCPAHHTHTILLSQWVSQQDNLLYSTDTLTTMPRSPTSPLLLARLNDDARRRIDISRLLETSRRRSTRQQHQRRNHDGRTLGRHRHRNPSRHEPQTGKIPRGIRPPLQIRQLPPQRRFTHGRKMHETSQR